jgi:hypothetical protein
MVAPWRLRGSLSRTEWIGNRSIRFGCARSEEHGGCALESVIELKRAQFRDRGTSGFRSLQIESQRFEGERFIGAKEGNFKDIDAFDCT